MLVWIGTKFGIDWFGKARAAKRRPKADQLPDCDAMRDLIKGLYF